MRECLNSRIHSLYSIISEYRQPFVYSRVISSDMLYPLYMLTVQQLLKNTHFYKPPVCRLSLNWTELAVIQSEQAEHNSLSAFTLNNLFYEYNTRSSHVIVITVKIKHQGQKEVQMMGRCYDLPDYPDVLQKSTTFQIHYPHRQITLH